MSESNDKKSRPLIQTNSALKLGDSMNQLFRSFKKTTNDQNVESLNIDLNSDGQQMQSQKSGAFQDVGNSFPFQGLK